MWRLDEWLCRNGLVPRLTTDTVSSLIEIHYTTSLQPIKPVASSEELH
jgi:hypothetical protein